VPTGIDIGDDAIVVATPEGVTRHRNAVRPLAGTAEGGESGQTVQTEHGVYAVGNAVDAYTDDGPITRLFGGAEELPLEVRAIATAAVLSVPEDGSDREQPLEGSRVGYVERGHERERELVAVLAELGCDSVAIDPAVAVCYDAFGAEPSGLGVALDDGRAYATLLAGGVPVASTTLAYADRWYDVGDDVGAVDEDGPGADWLATRYETLLGDLVSEVAADAPAFADPIDVALGGASAPAGVEARLEELLTAELRGEVGSVTVADAPAEAPARGALAGVSLDSEDARSSVPVPGFAADVGYVGGLSDLDTATARLDAGAHRPRARAGAANDAATASLSVTHGGAVGDDRATESARLETHSARLAAAHDRLVATVEAIASDERDQLRDDIQSEVAAVEDELEQLSESAARGDALAEVQDAVAELDARLETVDEDSRQARAVLAGLDDGHELDLEEVPGRELDAMALSTLQYDIDEVESELAGRLDGLWDELDDVNAELVDIAATLRDLPALESKLESTSGAVTSVREETNALRSSLTDLRETLDGVEDEMATAEAVQAVEASLARTASDVDGLSEQLSELEQAEPEELDDLKRAFDGLNDSLERQEQRLSGVERTTSDLDSRLRQAFRDTAKSEALASVQTEVSRVEQDASAAQESATSATQTAERLEQTVDTFDQEIEQIQTMIDRLAETSTTRSELEESVGDLESRLESHEATVAERLDDVGEGALDQLMVRVLAGTLGVAGALGAVLAVSVGQPLLGVAFALFVIGPAVWLSYTAEKTG